MIGKDAPEKRDAPAARLYMMLIMLLVGLAIGWSVRVNYSKDRYIQALAERHEAEASCWSKKTNDIITNNTLERNKRNANH